MWLPIIEVFKNAENNNRNKEENTMYELAHKRIERYKEEKQDAVLELQALEDSGVYCPISKEYLKGQIEWYNQGIDELENKNVITISREANRLSQKELSNLVEVLENRLEEL